MWKSLVIYINIANDSEMIHDDVFFDSLFKSLSINNKLESPDNAIGNESGNQLTWNFRVKLFHLSSELSADLTLLRNS